MGVGYYQQLVQWSKGEYNAANQLQDDLAIITGASNGFGYRPDDHGNTRTTATSLDTGATPAGAGIIETGTDVDYFDFTASQSGSFTLTVTPDPFCRRPPCALASLPH